MNRITLLTALLFGLATTRLTSQNPGVAGVVLAQDGDAVVVARLAKGGPAALAGVLEGDRLVRIGEEAIRDPRQARGALYRIAPGTSAELHLEREAKPLQVKVKLAEYAELQDFYKPRKPKLKDKVPSLWAEQWFLAEGVTKPPSLELGRGKVMVLLAYQAFCPGCSSVGFPVHAGLESDFADNKDVEFLYVHTVFEGFDHNTPEAGAAKARSFKLRGTIFEDARFDTAMASETVRLLGVGGTPWSIVIDREGRIAFSQHSGKSADLKKALTTAVQQKPKPN